MDELKNQILGFKDWDASKKGRALNRLKGKNLERFTGLPDDVVQAALDDELNAGSDEDWSSHWGTSAIIKQVTGANAPYEQWGVVATTTGGAAYLTRSFVRAHHLMQAARATSPADKQWHVAVAWAAPHEVEAAAFYAVRFMTRGVVIGLGAPLLWLAYLRMKHTTKRR